MDTKGRWDPSEVDEWYRRYRELVIVPVEDTAVEEAPPPATLDPEAFAPTRKNYGPS